MTYSSYSSKTLMPTLELMIDTLLNLQIKSYGKCILTNDMATHFE